MAGHVSAVFCFCYWENRENDINSETFENKLKVKPLEQYFLFYLISKFKLM
jgi:hypothetical protein